MAGVLKETWWEWGELGKSRGRTVRGNGHGVQSPVHGTGLERERSGKSWQDL